MNYPNLDAGSAFDFYIRSRYGSLSSFARNVLNDRIEQISPLFTGEEVTAQKIRAKLDWLKKKRVFGDTELALLTNAYGIDTDEMYQAYARAKGITITGDNNVTNSQDTSISIGNDPVLMTENTFLRRENENLKRQIERLEKTIDLLQGHLEKT